MKKEVNWDTDVPFYYEKGHSFRKCCKYIIDKSGGCEFS